MTAFYLSAAVLALLVVGWLLRPLLRPVSSAAVSSQQLNVAIYREQLEALERERQSGALSAHESDAARDELQLRMLDDTLNTGDSQVRVPSHRARSISAAVVALVLVLGSAGVYRWIGNPAAIDPVSAENAERDKVLKMVETLAQRLQANPDNPRGWAMLARSYKVIGRLDEAMQAYAKTGNLLETDPDLMADYADLLAVRAGDNLAGRPMELVNKALALNPQHPMALMLAAAQAYRENRFTQAITYWQTLQGVLDPQSPDAQQLQEYIADARQKAGLPAQAATTPATPSAVAAGAGPMATAAPLGAAPAGMAAPDGAPNAAQILQMVERLAQRLKTQPNDPAGWARLARSYKVLGRFDDARAAYAQAMAQDPKNAELKADYADLLASHPGAAAAKPPVP